MPNCSHDVPQERRTKPERFLEVDREYTLEEVLEMPLNLSRMPFDVNTMSPTPLDPYNVKVHGMGYVDASLEYMQANLYIATKELMETNPTQIQNAERELDFQHRHRVEKNNEAMERWREYASTNPHDQRLTHAEAEGILQVRSGTARLGAAIKLLSRNPEMKAIEVSTATRPFCDVSYHIAKQALLSSFQSFASNSDVDMTLTDRAGSAPYRHIIDERQHALIIKSKIARVSLNSVDIEIVGRESGILYNPLETPAVPEAHKKPLAGMMLEMVPLDITSYARVIEK